MLPKSMKAIRIFEYGGPEVLQHVDVPLPEIDRNEVLIKVMATSVTGWDLKYRKGQIKAPPGRDPLPMPFQLGRDMTGEVAAIGSGVTQWRKGDRVVGLVHPACGHCPNCVRGYDNLCLNTKLPGHQTFGGYAEYVVRSEWELLPAPREVPYETLGGFLWSYSTSWSIIQRRGNFSPGDCVLITGASGGMGTSAIDVCRFAGASPIIGVTGSPQKTNRLREIGCDHVINYKEDDAVERVKALSGRGGVDLVMDFVGGDLLDFGLKCLRMGGTFAVIGGGHLPTATISYYLMIGMAINIHGVRASKREDQETILRILADRKFHPTIDRVMPLEEAQEAHRILERREQVGKIVLVP